MDEVNFASRDLFLTSPFHVRHGHDLSLMKRQKKRSSLALTWPHLPPKIHEGSTTPMNIASAKRSRADENESI